MARYWVGGSGNWSDATNHWATTSGGAPGAGNLPTATDDVVFDSASHTTNYTVTLDTGTKLCRDLTFAAPAAGNVTVAGAVQIQISGSLALYSGLIQTFTGTIVFNATSGTRTITTAGKTLPNVTFSGSGGTFQLADDLTILGSGGGAAAITLTAGSFDPNGKTVTLNGTGNSGINITGAITFYNLTVTGVAAKTGNLNLTANVTVTNVLTINGNSATNRLIVRSNTRGTARTITAATVTVTNADFQDITGAGAGSWNLSAIPGGSGDCGGNSGITFTSPVTNYWVGGTGNWDAVAEWASSSGGSASSGRVPLPQDTARFDANSFSAGSQTVTQNMSRIGSVDWTGATNNPTWAFGTNFSSFGSITAISAMTFSSLAFVTHEGRGSCVLTSAGKTWPWVLTMNAPGGTWTLADAFTTSSTFGLTSGTFIDAGFNVTCTAFSSSGTATRALTMTGIWTITDGAETNQWFVTSTGLTLTATSSTIRLTGAFIAARNFGGAGLVYGNFSNESTGAFALQFSGNNTFNTFHVDASAAARTILFTAGTTTTVASFTRDAGTNVITIGSITAASHTLTKTGGGYNSLDYLSISRSTATPGSTWYAGSHSTNGGNNSGWVFGPAPLTASATAVSASWVAPAATAGLRHTAPATAASSSWGTPPAIAQTRYITPASPSLGSWVGPAAVAQTRYNPTASPSFGSWIAPNASASSSVTATATPASASWIAPNASASSAVTATATPASAVWVAPNASSTMTFPWIYAEGLCVTDLAIVAETVTGLALSGHTVTSLALEDC